MAPAPGCSSPEVLNLPPKPFGSGSSLSRGVDCSRSFCTRMWSAVQQNAVGQYWRWRRERVGGYRRSVPQIA
eukprot:2186873-Rhodomonas_salina.1